MCTLLGSLLYVFMCVYNASRKTICLISSHYPEDKKTNFATPGVGGRLSNRCDPAVHLGAAQMASVAVACCTASCKALLS